MDDKLVTGKQVLERERDDWQARAEAAEDDLRELRENTLLALGLNPVDVTAGMEDQSIAYLLGGLKEHVAELEARLADEWRPVDWDNVPTGKVWLYDRVMGCHEGEWDGEYWRTASRQLIVASHWRPLPPPPTAIAPGE